MDNSRLNYKHLYYFWVVAKEGSMTKASQVLDLAVQTISVQLGTLEESLGVSLFTLVGRRLELTEEGKVALNYADEIFLLGKQLRDVLRSQPKRSLRLTVGIADVLPKLMVYRLLEAVLNLEEPVRLVCYEGKFESLLSDLLMHKLDIILTDRSIATSRNLLLYNHFLGESDLTFFGTTEHVEKYKTNFPQSLHGAPMILPTTNSAIRTRLDQWFEKQQIYPDIMAEIEDSALLKTFGRAGLGLCIAPSVITNEVEAEYGLFPIGSTPDLHEEFFAISPERRIKHVAVAKLCATARECFMSFSS